MQILDIVLRSVISVAVLFLLTRMMGRKQISQLTVFDYAIGISIGSIAGEMAFSHELPYLEAVLAMVIYGLISVLIAFCTMKSIKLRRFFTGIPVVIIQNGKIVERNLRRLRYDLNDLLLQARAQGYFDLSDIAFAVMESNGQITFLPKAAKRPTVAGDFPIPLTEPTLTANLIVDGHIMRHHLQAVGRDEVWLRQRLQEQHAPPVKEILLATYGGEDMLTVYPRQGDMQEQRVLE